MDPVWIKGSDIRVGGIICTPPRQVAEFDQRDYYPDTPATVLSDEPGYVGTGALA